MNNKKKNLVTPLEKKIRISKNINMELITKQEVIQVSHLNKFGGDLLAKFLMNILKFNKLNQYYKELEGKQGIEYIDSIIEILNIKYEVNTDELRKIPQKGAFITVSNHPYGGIDGIILIKILSEIRPDFKVMANFLLQKVQPLSNHIIPVNPFENFKNAKSNLQGLKLALEHLKNGNVLGIFPAGEVSTFQTSEGKVIDRVWQKEAIKFIIKSQVPVVPIYFHGTNSRIFHIVSKIHPILRSAMLPSELLKKTKSNVIVRIGSPVQPKELNEFENINTTARFLRAKTYMLGSPLKVKKIFNLPFKKKPVEQTEIIAPIATELILAEIENMKHEAMLLTTGDYSIFCSQAYKIPNILQEIGRLREITFRTVGEGTNKSKDLDEYDLYYHHLILWDNSTSQIVGAYRLGKGADILKQYGKNGFYIKSLFKIKNEFVPILSQSIELGRSFIINEYQRKALPLFLLWKGIFTFLLKNQEYRYLIGPASISDKFSEFSQSLIVDFLRKNYLHTEFSKWVKPKNEFNIKSIYKKDKETLIESTKKNFKKLETYIKDIESNLAFPILLKKYLSMNAKVITFNLDPDFSNVLDCLIIVDVLDLPEDIVKSLNT
jgi:putative hemolysin